MCGGILLGYCSVLLHCAPSPPSFLHCGLEVCIMMTKRVARTNDWTRMCVIATCCTQKLGIPNL